MNLDAIFAEFYDAASSREVCFSALLRLAQHVGFSDVTLNGMRVVNGQFQRTTDLHTSVSQQWQEELRDVPLELVNSDPILCHMGSRSDPLPWDRRTYTDTRYYEQFHEHGIASGIAAALPLAEPGHRLCVGFSSAEPCVAESPHLASQMAALMLAASLTTAAFNAPVPKSPAPCPLSSRELEVLRWVRDGKSSWAIGVILSISEGTVANHMRNIVKKLGVATRMQAVVLATHERWL